MMTQQAATPTADKWAPIILGAVLGLILSGALAVGVGIWQAVSPAMATDAVIAPVLLPIYSGEPANVQQLPSAPPVAIPVSPHPNPYQDPRDEALRPVGAEQQQDASTPDFVPLAVPSTAPIKASDDEPSSD